MANTSIIFYGKPQSWESYEFNKSGYKRGDIGTPALKPRIEDGAVLHYYVQDGCYYLELYEFATAYDTARSGVVIGVCIKSDSALAVSAKNISILSELLTYYKSKGLTENLQFNTYDLLDIVENFNLDEKIYELIELNDAPHNDDGIKLLFLENYKKHIDSISQYADTYSNVYVSQDSSIYKTPINEKIWRDAGKQILTVNENGELVSPDNKLPKLPRTNNSGVITGGSTGGDDLRKRQAAREAEAKRERKRKQKKIIGFLSVACLAVAFFFNFNSIVDSGKTLFSSGKNLPFVAENSDNKTNDSETPPEQNDEEDEVAPKTPSKVRINIPTNGRIGDSFQLKPKLLDSQGNELTENIANIQWGNSQYYTIDNEGKLTITQTNRPTTDQRVTITATYNGQSLTVTQNQFTVIAKPQQTDVTCEYNGFSIPNYIRELQKSFNEKEYDWVIRQCNTLLESDCVKNMPTELQAIQSLKANAERNNCTIDGKTIEQLLQDLERDKTKYEFIILKCDAIIAMSCATETEKNKAKTLKAEALLIRAAFDKDSNFD